MNFSKLNNLSTPELNITQQLTSNDLIPTIVESANTTSEGYFGLGIMVISFLVLTMVTFRQDGDIRLDITRSMFIASGFSSIIGIVMLVSGLISSLQHVIWFIILFVVLFFAVANMKKKGV